jgi:signal transduction histidine kinase
VEHNPSLHELLARRWLEPAAAPERHGVDRVVRFSAVLLVNALALLVAYLLGNGEGQVVPIVAFVVAVSATSWLGGRILGLGAVALATWGANYLVFSPGSITVDQPEDLLRLTSLTVVAFVVSTVNYRRADLERSEQQRQAAERDRGRVETLLDQGLTPVLLLDAETHDLVFANLAARELARGRYPFVADGGSPTAGLLSAAGELTAATWPVAPEIGGPSAAPLRVEWQLPEGSRILLVSLRQLAATPEHRPLILVSYQDFTEAEEAAQALRFSEARYAVLAEAAAVGILHLDPQGRILYANSQAGQLLALAEDEASAAGEASSPRGALPLPEPLSGGPLAFKEWRQDRDGRDRWLSIRLTPLPESRHPTYVGVVDDLTQQHEVETGLRALSEQRAELVSTVSHALRGPLAAILANLEVLQGLAEEGRDPREARLTANAVRATLNLTETVDDILCLSRLQSGREEIARAPCALSEVFRRIQQQMLARATAAGLTLEAKAPPAEPLLSDARHLERALLELVENAVKYAPPGGRIVLSAREEGDTVRISVRNSGGHLDPTDLPHLFEPFYRGAEAESSQAKGSGLGLAIVARLAALLGGDVEAGNCPDGWVRFDLIHPRRLPAE